MFLFRWRKELKEVLGHIATINDELGKVQRDVVGLKRDVVGLKRDAVWTTWLVRGIFLMVLGLLLRDLLS